MSTIRMSVKPKNLGKFEKMFPGELVKAQRREFHSMGHVVKEMLQTRSAASKWKGRFQMGWRFKTTPYSLTVFNKADHAIFVEKGRRPGAKPPPAQAILPWVKDKLGGNIGTAFVVARSIGRKGIAPKPVLTDPAVEREIDQELSKRIKLIWAKAAKASSLWGRFTGAPTEL